MDLTCLSLVGVVRACDTPLGYEVINLGNGRPYQLRAFIQVRVAPAEAFL